MKTALPKRCLLICILLATGTTIDASIPALQDSFGDAEDQTAAYLIAQISGADSAAIYAGLSREEKARFLETFWTQHNPLVLKYYYGYHLGQRHYNVSDAFFENGDLIYPFFYQEAIPPGKKYMSEGVKISESILERSPEDAIAMCSLGYFYLEQNEIDQAKNWLQKADRKQKRFLEARNGLALAILRTPKQKTRAQKLFEEIISIDRNYGAAWYNLSITHLSLASSDLFYVLKKTAKRFPKHHDAHFKLGACYERSHYYEEAVTHYIDQLKVNPNHTRAQFYAARAAVELIHPGKAWPDIPNFEMAVKTDPKTFLPLQAEVYLSQKAYKKAEANYVDFFNLLSPAKRNLYEDISLVANRTELQTLEKLPPPDQDQFLKRFWQMKNPTPTSTTNPRKLEHYRRVHYAQLNYSEGKYPWDRRGEVYIRFGHPEHRTWSDHMIMETDPAVVSVKKRINERVLNKPGAIEELENTSFIGTSSLGVWGRPIFPIENLSKWEAWIYTEVNGGIEVAFVDNVVNFSYDYPELPTYTDLREFWRDRSAFTVVETAISKAPSIYTHEYGGEALRAHYSTADFRASDGESGLEIYLGVDWADMKLETKGRDKCGKVDWVTVLYNSEMTPVYRDSNQTEGCIPGSFKPSKGTLLIDQLRVDLKPGMYFLGLEVRDHNAKKVQFFRDSIQVETYNETKLAISDLEVASTTEPRNVREGKFAKGDLQVIPLPSHAFKKNQSVYLYYEVYNLKRNEYGQTNYRVEYSFKSKGKNAALRLLKGVGKLAGLTRSSGEIRMSYDHQGNQPWEPIYIALDKVAASGKGLMEVTVQITDLNAEGNPTISKQAHFTIND